MDKFKKNYQDAQINIYTGLWVPPNKADGCRTELIDPKATPESSQFARQISAFSRNESDCQIFSIFGNITFGKELQRIIPYQQRGLISKP